MDNMESLRLIARGFEFERVTDRQAKSAVQSIRNAADEIQSLRTDAERFRWVVRHASLNFDDSLTWGAVIRLPVFNSADQTITALVDRARAAVGAA